jgi:hypothetical protein
MFRNADNALLHVPGAPFGLPFMLNLDGPEMHDSNWHAWAANGAIPAWVYNEMVSIDWGAEC